MAITSIIDRNKLRFVIFMITFIVAYCLITFIVNTTYNSTKQEFRQDEKISSHGKMIRKKLSLQDITHTIKTSKQFHNTRAEVIVLTWFQKVANQTYFITDEEDLNMQIKTNNHLIVTSCSNDHSRKGLNCKMGFEFDTYIKNEAKWWCHWDDDNYVNVNELVKLLDNFDPKKLWFIGRTSVNHTVNVFLHGEKISFWFQHGGCGFCISQALVEKMKQFAANGEFFKLGSKLNTNDDLTVGFIVNHLLGVPLTQSQLFNSHYHRDYMMKIPQKNLTKQVSLSYSGKKIKIQLDEGKNIFTSKQDPTRFFSLHCILYPDIAFCNK